MFNSEFYLMLANIYLIIVACCLGQHRNVPNDMPDRKFFIIFVAFTWPIWLSLSLVGWAADK